jgi:hypothetical protein
LFLVVFVSLPREERERQTNWGQDREEMHHHFIAPEEKTTHISLYMEHTTHFHFIS